jgi:phycocyanin beta chain
MHDAFTRSISQAGARGEFLSDSQLEGLSAAVADGNKRLDAVNRITGSATAIVANAARALFAEQPQLIAPGGNAYTNRRLAACLRDLEIILRYVTYATFTGDASVLEDRCLNGLRETYIALGVPGNSVAAGVQKMKEAAIAIANDRAGITQGDCSNLMAEIAGYFDMAAAAVVVGYSETSRSTISAIDKPTKSTKKDKASDRVTELLKARELISRIDQKRVDTWIEEGVDAEYSKLIAGRTYTLNLQISEPETIKLANKDFLPFLSMYKLAEGINTEWFVVFSNVKFSKNIPKNILIDSQKIEENTFWTANFNISVPIFGDSAISSLEIIPEAEQDASLSILIYAFSELYRKIDIDLDVVAANRESEFILNH